MQSTFSTTIWHNWELDQQYRETFYWESQNGKSHSNDHVQALISTVETKTIPEPGAINEVEKVDMGGSDCRT